MREVDRKTFEESNAKILGDLFFDFPVEVEKAFKILRESNYGHNPETLNVNRFKTVTIMKDGQEVGTQELDKVIEVFKSLDNLEKQSKEKGFEVIYSIGYTTANGHHVV